MMKRAISIHIRGEKSQMDAFSLTLLFKVVKIVPTPQPLRIFSSLSHPTVPSVSALRTEWPFLCSTQIFISILFSHGPWCLWLISFDCMGHYTVSDFSLPPTGRFSSISSRFLSFSFALLFLFFSLHSL